MPLTKSLQISSLAAYKTLLQADARAMTATGTKFQFFSKFTFGDKTTATVIFFGEPNPTILTAATKTGPASGRAHVNEADEIVLEATKGEVKLLAFATILKAHGVTRALAVSKGTEENSTPKTNGPTSTAPQRTLPTPPVQPTTTKPPVPSRESKPGSSTTPPPQNPTPGVRERTGGPGVRPPVPNPGLSKSPAEPLPKPPSPNVRSRTGGSDSVRPPMPNPKIIPPTGQKTPPQRPPRPDLPVSGKKLFDLRFSDLSPRYTKVAHGQPQLKQLHEGMLKKAKLADFSGALADLRKLDSAVSEAEVTGQRQAKQGRRASKLNETFGAVRRSYFTPGSTQAFERMKLKPGKEFKTFLEAHTAFETKRDEGTLTALEKAAQAYLQHLTRDFDAVQQRQPEKLKKKEICLNALKGARHYRLALAQEKLGPPPWDFEKETQAAELYSKLLFEQEDDKLAAPNDEAGVTGSWWLEKTAWDDTESDAPEKKKTFIFKPSDADAPVPGFPLGGAPAREVLGKVVSDQLSASMGIDFGVPETSIISVANSKLPNSDGEIDDTKPEQRSGSIQHFAKSQGQLMSKWRDDSFLSRFDPEDVQKQAVLDLVSLNMDRHAGNYMVGEKDGPGGTKVPTLIPIDNGLTIPSREGLETRRLQMGTDHSALARLPGYDSKMSPEMVDKIQQIDPDKVVAGMKEAFATMSKLHPETAKSSEISEENFKLTKRSILFLKKASGELTLGEIQDAYVQAWKRFSTRRSKIWMPPLATRSRPRRIAAPPAMSSKR